MSPAARRRPTKDQSLFPVLADAGAAGARARFPSADSTRTTCASTRASAGCRSPTSRTARRSASCPTATTRVRRAARRPEPRGAGVIVDDERPRARPARRRAPLHRRPAQGPRGCRRPASRCTCWSSARRRRGRRRAARGARATQRCTASQRELDCGDAAGGSVRVGSADPPSPRAGAGDRDARSATTARRSTSTRRSARSRPGQAVVFYDGDEVVGGGWIDCESRSRADLALDEVTS